MPRSPNTSGSRTGSNSGSEYVSPPPSYSSRDPYGNGTGSSDRLSSSISSLTSSSSSSASTLAPNGVSGAGSRYSHHSHYHHNVYNNVQPNGGDNEASPLLSTNSSERRRRRNRHQGPNERRCDNDNSDTITCTFNKNRLLAYLVFGFIGTYLIFSRKSALTSVWVDITPSEVCHSVGVREYTATLTNVPEDWDPFQACQKTSVTIHGKVIEAPPILCMHVPVPSHASDGEKEEEERKPTTVVQGKWTVDFDESDCIPIWSSINSEDCIGLGVRPYHANLAYVPPGLDRLSSCQATPVMIHGREMFPTRCELLFDRDHHGRLNEQRHDWNETLIARGEWDVDFDEDGCVPKWSEPITPHECLSFGTRHYSSDLVVPRGLERMALTLAQDIPATIYGKRIFPNHFEQLDQDDGIQTVRGHWVVSFSEPSCEPSWTEVNEDWQCHAYDKKKFTGFLKDVPGELDPLKTCYEAPLTFASNGQEFRKVPDECEWDWERMKGTWFVGAPNCRPVLKNIIDYGCMENEPGFKRIEGEVVDIGKHEDWYRMCTTVPYHTSGKTYLPVQCESRTSWFKTRRYALYNIPAWNC